MRGVFVWKTENSNSVRRMSNINENLFAMLQANPEKMAKMSAIKEFDESKFVVVVDISRNVNIHFLWLSHLSCLLCRPYLHHTEDYHEHQSGVDQSTGGGEAQLGHLERVHSGRAQVGQW